MPCLYFVYTVNARKHRIKPYFCHRNPNSFGANQIVECVFLKVHYLSILVYLFLGAMRAFYTPAFFLYI